MTDQPPPVNQPTPKRSGWTITLWLLLALSPTALIILAVDRNKGEVAGLAPLVMFGLNPVVSIFACYKVFRRPDGDKTAPFIGAFFLGLVLAAINALVGFFGGCACGGHFDMR